MSVCNPSSFCKVVIVVQCDPANSFVIFYKMSQYKLIYFDLRAIAEPIRLIFAYAGVQYEDKRISFADWPSVKPTLPMGKIPVLMDGDKQLTQSSTIARYLAKKFDLIPENDFDKARCDEVVDMLSDIVSQWRPFVLEENAEEKAKKSAQLLDGIITTSLKWFETLMKENDNHEHIVGSKTTWADLTLAHFLETFQLTVDVNVLDNYPLLKEFKDKVFHIPQIKEYVDKRPKFTMA